MLDKMLRIKEILKDKSLKELKQCSKTKINLETKINKLIQNKTALILQITTNKICNINITINRFLISKTKNNIIVNFK